MLGLLWVLAAAGAVMAPALGHGQYLGSFDWVSRYGLSRVPGATVHNPQAFDSITEFIPWANLAWTQVHQGHVPLWNPYTVLGTPLAFNWQAGTFGLPALVGYLFPLHLAYTVQVMVTLVVAGTGTYVAGRVMGLGALGAVMAATVYELSGPLLGWLGSPITSVMSWAGWLFAATVLVVRGRHPVRSIAFFAVVTAFAVYAGQPDTLVNLGSALLVFLVGLLVARTAPFGGSGPIRRPLLHTAVAVVAGAALSAPLLLPGLQVLPASVRAGKNLSQALPLGSITRTLFQGFDGLPLAGSRWFGPGYYTRTVVYVGVVAVVMAGVAVTAAVKGRARRPEVLAFGAVAVVMAAVVYVPVVESLLDGLPLVGSVQWRRSTTAMVFALAVLAGIGTDALVRSSQRRGVRTWTAVGFGAAAVVLLLLWLAGRGHLPPAEAGIRARSFIWPAALTALGLAVTAGVSVWPGRRPRHGGAPRRRWVGAGAVAGACLVAGETAFLVAAGGPLMSSSPSYPEPTPAEAALTRAVGSSLVGFGTNTCFSTQLGIVPNFNVALAVKELAAYEPLLPQSYGESWRDLTGQPAAPVQTPIVPFAMFCPAVTSVSVARRYGVGFVLEPAGAAGPPGSVFDRTVGDERLYRIPGAAPATLTPAPSATTLPAPGAPGAAVPVTQPDASSWRIVTDAAGPAVLRLRLSDAPGWHATIDGRPLPLESYAGVMLQARVPPGHHVVTVRYWPGTFTAGIVLAVVALAGLGAAALSASVRRRRRSGAGAATAPS